MRRWSRLLSPDGLVRTVGSPAVAKVLVMGTSGLIGIFTSRMIIGHFGTDAYAQYGLLATLPSLLPFADLGIASVIFNVLAASRDPIHDPVVQRTLTTALRVLLVAGATIAGVALLITVLDLWEPILGGALLPGAELAPMFCLLIFAFALPLTIGQRMLIGLGRNTTQVLNQAVIAPFIFVAVVALVRLGASGGNHLAELSYLGSALVSLISIVVVSRILKGTFGKAVRDVPRVRAVPGVKVLDLAWPMLVQMLALPIAMQTDRLLLSHLTSGGELAQYNLAAQLFAMVLQAISTGGLALWPVYARARARGDVRSPVRPALVFAVGGFGLAAVFAVLAPWIAGFVSRGDIVLSPWQLVGWVVFVTLQATKYPLGMYMTDKRGLTFQVWPILVLVPVNLGLSWLLIGVVGAAGPIFGSAASVLVCQVLPNFWYVRRDVARRRLAAQEGQAT